MKRVTTIPPVFVVGTGRCGSTMISKVLNRHPDVLSLSEFFGFLELKWCVYRRRSGEQMWDFYSRHRKRTRLMLRGHYEELLYPFDDQDARYTRRNLPPILCTTLPNLTSRHEELFDELRPFVQAQPKQRPADHFRSLFEWLCERFGRKIWVERSGTSLMLVSKLMHEFPDARFIHIYRDGREVAISMSRHYLFRTILANVMLLRRFGVDTIKMMANGRRWQKINPWLELLANGLINPSWLPYDKAALSDYAAFWQVQIDMTHDLFSQLPATRLLNIRFEDMLAQPEEQLQRLIRFIDPSLENKTWLQEVSGIPRPVQPKFEQLGDYDKAAIIAACRAGLESLDYPV